MKAVFVNGSPRKDQNTFALLNAAMAGARHAGADVQLLALSDAVFSGCTSCFACKIKNNQTNGLCAVHDALRPILETALQADVIMIGSPIYFGDITGQTKSFLERLLFPIHTYLADPETGERVKKLDRSIPNALILSMNVTASAMEALHYPAVFQMHGDFLAKILGDHEVLCVHNTCQFSDYDRYEVNIFSETEKRQYRDAHFPIDLQNAYALGERLVERAKKTQP